PAALHPDGGHAGNRPACRRSYSRLAPAAPSRCLPPPDPAGVLRRTGVTAVLQSHLRVGSLGRPFLWRVCPRRRGMVVGPGSARRMVAGGDDGLRCDRAAPRFPRTRRGGTRGRAAARYLVPAAPSRPTASRRTRAACDQASPGNPLVIDELLRDLPGALPCLPGGQRRLHAICAAR